ncbi:putative helicase [Mycobacterium tuberculosis]|nr:putative helicase [Mycobacterium tuberculosis]
MGVRVGTVVGPVPGGATVVTVSGGSCGRKVLGEGWGDVLVGAVGRGEVDITVRGAGAPTMALVDVLSPLLIMTAVATAPSATTLPRIAATGRHRRSAAQANSPSEQVRPAPKPLELSSSR